MNISMANDHPFQLLFETLGRVPSAHAESVNRQAYEILSDILTVPIEKTGRCILLRAPRAGHGKTHLLSRIQHQFGASCEFIPLHSTFGCRIDAASVINDTLRRLVRQLPASGGLTVLDLVTRRLFAAALQPLVSSGEVPCQDREGALTALRARPIETFDFHHPSAVTAHWARENFEVLGQRLSLELAQRSTLPVSEVAFWVDALFRFAAAPLENSSRIGMLAASVHGGTGLEMARLEALLGMLTLVMRVVLVADDLEGFSADETAALRLAAFLGALRQSVERLDVILSLNQDIWQSAFIPRLSGGLVDRLSEVVVELEPLKESEMAELLDSRVPGLGSRILARIDVGESGAHARGLIRAAGMAWLKATAMDSAPAPVISPAYLPTPVAGNVFPPVIPTPFQQAPTAPAVIGEVAAPVFETARVEEPTQTVESPPLITVPDALALAENVSPEIPLAPAAGGIPEPKAYQAVEDASPFRIESPEPPVATFTPPATHKSAPIQASPVEESAPVNTWNSPATIVNTSFQAEPPAWTPDPPVASFVPPAWQEPVQASGPFVAEQAPKVQFSSPVFIPEPQPYYPPPVESPFQVAASQFAPEPPETTFAPPVWQQPTTVVTPPAESPFQAAEPEPPVATFAPPVWQQPATAATPPAESPFQAAAPEPPVATFAPPVWQQPTTAATPPAESPFQAAAPEPPVATFAPPVWQQPTTVVTPRAESPFHAPAPEFTPSAPPVDVTPEPSAADTDRVDDLLRQFRERYGRGSL